MSDDRETVMRKTGVKQGLLGALTAAAVLAGCEQQGHLWSLMAQEDYYPDQAQGEMGRERSNLGTTSTLYETTEQAQGTGGSGGGDPKQNERDNVWSPERIQGSTQEQENLPLRAGPKGAWVQGTYAVELGANAGRPRGVAPLAGPGGVTPRTQPEGREVAPPQQPTSDKPRGREQ
jgi:hypothetical protein